MSEKKLFFYNLPADEVEVFDINKCFMISEEELPKPSKEYNLCAISCKRIPKKIPIGSKIRIALGDPIIPEEEVTFLSRKINDTDPGIPKEIRALRRQYQEKVWNIDTFEYRGGKIWVLDDFVCLLDDLEEECRKLKERKKN